MKANETPEKVYLHLTTGSQVLNGKYYEYKPAKIRFDDEIIEYTRTDAFIEKALKWYCLDCICNDTCSNICYFKSTFKKYLEGDDKQLPPKIENAINPDGSTTENYRYRHFISRMQDAFIEKAKKWFEKRNEWFDLNGNRHCDRESFEDFVNYMKGE